MKKRDKKIALCSNGPRATHVGGVRSVEFGLLKVCGSVSFVCVRCDLRRVFVAAVPPSSSRRHTVFSEWQEKVRTVKELRRKSDPNQRSGSDQDSGSEGSQVTTTLGRAVGHLWPRWYGVACLQVFVRFEGELRFAL